MTTKLCGGFGRKHLESFVLMERQIPPTQLSVLCRLPKDILCTIVCHVWIDNYIVRFMRICKAIYRALYDTFLPKFVSRWRVSVNELFHYPRYIFKWIRELDLVKSFGEICNSESSRFCEMVPLLSGLQHLRLSFYHERIMSLSIVSLTIQFCPSILCELWKNKHNVTNKEVIRFPMLPPSLTHLELLDLFYFELPCRPQSILFDLPHYSMLTSLTIASSQDEMFAFQLPKLSQLHLMHCRYPMEVDCKNLIECTMDYHSFLHFKDCSFPQLLECTLFHLDGEIDFSRMMPALTSLNLIDLVSSPILDSSSLCELSLDGSKNRCSKNVLLGKLPFLKRMDICGLTFQLEFQWELPRLAYIYLSCATLYNVSPMWVHKLPRLKRLHLQDAFLFAKDASTVLSCELYPKRESSQKENEAWEWFQRLAIERKKFLTQLTSTEHFLLYAAF